MLENVWV
jgi:hypothetical protein